MGSVKDALTNIKAAAESGDEDTLSNYAMDERSSVSKAAQKAIDRIDGLEDAEVTIDDTEAEVLAAYAGNDPAYNEIVPIIFLAFEKVIDLPKPELATYGDPELIPAFQSVPQCQHGVKDADDGVPRYVPLEPAPRPQ